MRDGERKDIPIQERTPRKIKEAYRNAHNAIIGFETEMEQLINQAHEAEKAGNNIEREKFLEQASYRDLAIKAIGYSMQENFGVSHMKEKEEEKKRWKKT